MFEFIIQGLKVVALSDTHGKHRSLSIPSCDVLIHAGDACDFGNKEQLEDFFEWYGTRSARYKIFVSGNHDTNFETANSVLESMIPENVIYLENSLIDIEGVTFASLSVRDKLQCFIENELINVFITHGAPFGIQDENGKGCKNLARQIQLLAPQYALFGHFHKGDKYPLLIEKTVYVNVSL
ncbi:metallophosphoesterase [Bacteroides sp. ET225]|uniref:Metallophosphoesterase family protein n=1 Tax=Candidatus Phocaeicola excrementipullorum TaxID=2838731 RepID=A0A948TNR2_9BACT|nr:metallophosphoesterase family protein [Bacteroides sp. ET225]MBU3856732.1 metallophosphoesterase family protein [Candidatus Phocaeicola excrementipullorum]MBW9200728.1 serine/threonine protein phosphatase [Bacteroidales bacterium SW299]MCR8918838.1 metallophosphoesterase family protein [Bacteroides sp. ET225]